MFYWFSYYLILFLGAIFSPRKVLGKDRLPSGAYILASNHLSNLDPFLIGLSVGRRIAYMAKDTLFQKPVLKFCLDRVEAFPVKRGASDVRALRETLRRLERGLPVVVFPEGTRGGSGTEKKTRSGIGFLALKANVPVVPVHIGGSDTVLPPGEKIPKRGRVTITFGDPMSFSKEHSYDEIMTMIMEKINTLSEGPVQ